MTANLTEPGPLRTRGDNIVLVGMPGAGKSTLGVLLAKATARAFVDTDVAMQVREGRALQAILEQEGPLGFRRVEEETLLALDCRATVIATGGSAVYSARAMQHLQTSGVVVFLELPLVELRRRLANFGARGVVRTPGQTLAELFDERQPLYRRYADIVVDCQGLSHEQAVERIIAALAAR